jgi:hypothetical protein
MAIRALQSPTDKESGIRRIDEVLAKFKSHHQLDDGAGINEVLGAAISLLKEYSASDGAYASIADHALTQPVRAFELSMQSDAYQKAARACGHLRSLRKELELATVTKLPSDVPATHRLENLLKRFHRVARSLGDRHAKRTTLTINDEYDVQDLLRSLLWVDFDDIRPEEWSPSYAGGSKRMDFLLKIEKIVVEVKKTRDGLADKEVGDQLTIDLANYQGHPDCNTLVCFVYDPEQRIKNPTGLKNDLEKRFATPTLSVVVVIAQS